MTETAGETPTEDAPQTAGADPAETGTTVRGRTRPWMTWAAAIALLAVTWGVAQITPPSRAAEAPFVVAAQVGEQAVGRDLVVTVTGIRLSDGAHGTSAADSRMRWEAEGTWLVADLVAEARVSDFGALLSLQELVVDGVHYSASDRPVSARGLQLRTALPQAGGIAFELPARAAAADTAVLRLGLDRDDRLDSVIELTIDLPSVERVTDAEVRVPEWTAPGQSTTGSPAPEPSGGAS
ncbi:hypothetical protein [Microbacterium sp. No. 7]|uniref:hypothetical protein n=1 Tax=Microbacterium sp. No. 7 TaxID=1714373 RepID=UPI0006D213BF|nr:hypothetical protein [Microbacterium sp. No. 7]